MELSGRFINTLNLIKLSIFHKRRVIFHLKYIYIFTSKQWVTFSIDFKGSLKVSQTSMHSSRMRTTRLLTVLGGLHPGGSTQPGGVCIQGCLPNLGGVYIQGGWAYPLPPVNRMTHSCKNITLPQTSLAGGNKHYHQRYETMT